MHPTHVETFGTTRRDIVVAESSSPAYQAYQILHIAFVVVPLIAGLDKFTDWLVNWDAYLSPSFSFVLPISDHRFMMIVGAVEIVAGLIVALKPRIGARIVALWMLAIIVNLVMAQSHFDVALRDFGLMLGALALGRLSLDFDEDSTELATT